MKLKFLILSIACMAAFAMPAQRLESAKSSNSVATTVASTQEFNSLKTTLSNAIAKMKSAKSASAVTTCMYDYTKSFLGMSNVYKKLSSYQKNQIDVLVKQFGVQSKAKIAQYGCKKEADAAIQKATLEVLSAMKK